MSRRSTKDLLVQARELIADEEYWIKGDFADESAPNRPALCAIGAVDYAFAGKITERAGFYGIGSLAWRAEQALMKAIPHSYSEGLVTAVETFNDDEATSHADILALFDRAIEAVA